MNAHDPSAGTSSGPEAPRRTFLGSVRAGLDEIRQGARNWRVWYLMGSADMRRRFDRSTLGPAWIAISTAVMVLAIGVLWSTLWKAPIDRLLPFMAVGLVTWQFVSNVVSDSSMGFPGNAGYFANQYMAPSNVIFAIGYKNLLTYLINLPVPLIVCVVFGVRPTWATLLALPGLAILIYTMFWASYVVAILCARFRDVIQVVQNLMLLGFFMTPILWTPETLTGAMAHLIYLNPFASLVTIVREPLLGHTPPALAWQVALGTAVVLTLVGIPLIGRVYRRIVYWL